jgi:hypothetical protein
MSATLESRIERVDVVNDAIERIQSLDLSKIHLNLMDTVDGPGWDEEKCNQVQGQYRLMLLAVMVDPMTEIAPTKDVDKFWHYHILDTRRYTDDCEFLTGKMIHHDPYLGMEGPDSVAEFNEAWDNTKNITVRLGLSKDQLELLGIERTDISTNELVGTAMIAAFCGMSGEEKAAFCGMSGEEKAAFCAMRGEEMV